MRNRQQGFSLIEMMLVMVIFLVVTGTVFGLLNSAQTRYRAELEFLESFQGARLGMDMMVRDIHNAGYPPPYTFAGNLGSPPTPPPPYPPGIWTVPSAAPPALQRRFATGILGITGGVVDPNCTVNGGGTPCAIPNNWDIVLELDIDPENTAAPNQVEWVRYTLTRAAGATTSTLFRTVSTKVPGTNPAAALSNIPFVENIVQNPGAAVLATNPAVFTYDCDPSFILIVGPPPVCTAEHVNGVYITLQVQSVRRDIQTRRFQQITVQGAATRMNPSR